MDEHEQTMIYLVNQNHYYRTTLLPWLRAQEIPQRRRPGKKHFLFRRKRK